MPNKSEGIKEMIEKSELFVWFFFTFGKMCDAIAEITEKRQQI